MTDPFCAFNAFNSSNTTSFRTFNVGSLHTGRTGLYNACTPNLRSALTILERVMPTLSAILLATRNALVAFQLIEDVGNCFQFGEGQSADR